MSTAWVWALEEMPQCAQLGKTPKEPRKLVQETPRVAAAGGTISRLNAFVNHTDFWPSAAFGSARKDLEYQIFPYLFKNTTWERRWFGIRVNFHNVKFAP